MEIYTHFHCESHNDRQHDLIDLQDKCENLNVYFSTLDDAFRREFINALHKGALSRCETLLDGINEGECKKWLTKRLSEMDFETILNSIVSA